MSQLQPELYLKIAQQVKRVFPVYDGAVPAIKKAINAEQATLVNLMKSSKVSSTSTLFAWLTFSAPLRYLCTGVVQGLYPR